MRSRLFGPLVLLAFGAALSGADSWPGFRGPTGDGHAAGKNVPTTWSEKENVRWKTEIHGKGWSSPVVLGDQVWVTTADELLDPNPPMKKGGGAPANPVKEVTLCAVCVDRKTGAVLHDLKLHVVEKPQYCHPFNSYASPTPFIEEGRLYAHFGSLGTFGVDTATGKVLWKRTDLKCDHFRGPGSSPAVYGDLLYLIFDGFDLQYVVALDKKTGETKWKTDRKIKYSSDNGDYKKAYATPVLVTVGGKDWLVCPSAECTMAYDPKTGAELWRFTHGGMNGSAPGDGQRTALPQHRPQPQAVRAEAGRVERCGAEASRVVAGGEGRIDSALGAGRQRAICFSWCRTVGSQRVSKRPPANRCGTSGWTASSRRRRCWSVGTCTSATSRARRSW